MGYGICYNDPKIMYSSVYPITPSWDTMDVPVVGVLPVNLQWEGSAGIYGVNRDVDAMLTCGTLDPESTRGTWQTQYNASMALAAGSLPGVSYATPADIMRSMVQNSVPQHPNIEGAHQRHYQKQSECTARDMACRDAPVGPGNSPAPPAVSPAQASALRGGFDVSAGQAISTQSLAVLHDLPSSTLEKVRDLGLSLSPHISSVQDMALPEAAAPTPTASRSTPAMRRLPPEATVPPSIYL